MRMQALSIIMPCACFDAKARLSLTALLPQMRGQDQLILVMDGGKPPEGLDERVSVLNLPVRRGPAAARNHGARAADHEVLLFIDADVAIHAGSLDKVRAFFARDEGDAVFGSYDDAPGDPGWVSQFRNLQHHHVHVTHAGPALTFWAGCGAVRRSVFVQMGGFDETFHRPSIEDIELGSRLAAAGHRIVLDASLLGKHLKRWPLLPMWRNDLLCRAIPWSRLILRSGKMLNGLNTDRWARMAVLLQGLVFLLMLLALLEPWLLAGCFATQVMAAGCHGRLLAFLVRRRGVVFGLCCVPLVIAYVVISGAGFAWAVAGHWAAKRQPQDEPMGEPGMETDVA